MRTCDFAFPSHLLPNLGPGLIYFEQRFMNHHYRSNISTKVMDYGHRRVVMFRARCNIAAGEQLFISYARGYFTDHVPPIECLCDRFDKPHFPPEKDDDDADWDKLDGEAGPSEKGKVRIRRTGPAFNSSLMRQGMFSSRLRDIVDKVEVPMAAKRVVSHLMRLRSHVLGNIRVRKNYAKFYNTRRCV